MSCDTEIRRTCGRSRGELFLECYQGPVFPYFQSLLVLFDGLDLKAGGVGLNLTGADTVILVDLWWNPAVESQAIGRAHRMGQDQAVEVYRLVTRGTIEEKIQELQEQKKNLVSEVWMEQSLVEV